MRSFYTYFDLTNIVSTLASLRARTALKRHETDFYWKLFRFVPEPVESVPRLADPYLPPRRQWRRADRSERAQRTADGIAAHAIKRTVLGLSRNNKLPESEWGQKLLELVDKLQNLIHSGSISLTPPKILLLPKPQPRKTTAATRFRAIATYEDITDRLVLSQTAKYLRDAIDDQFLDVSYAFRAKHGYSHNKAVENIIEYRKTLEKKNLYVAECDISKFFDTINHQVVKDSFAKLVDRVSQKTAVQIDPVAIRVVDAYLASYSFRSTVLRNPDLDIQKRVQNGFVDQADLTVLKMFYRKPETESLGIPQGGALSPFLANCVLDVADRAVLSDNDPELFYARFCDDMILIHPDRKKCQAALDRYLAAMKKLKLPAHEIVTNIKYGPDYYSSKSKGPFKWAAATSNRRTMPWISFVGYQIRYDGEVRLRKQTIGKHFDQQKEEVVKAIKYLEKEGSSHKSSSEDIFNKIRCRMISMGVGKLSIRSHLPGIRQLCWIDAFPLLTACQHSINQLRGLDKNRDRQLKRLNKVLHREDGKEQGNTISKGETIGQKPDERPPHVFYGKPFSYVGFLTRTRDIYIKFKSRVSSLDAYRS